MMIDFNGIYILVDTMPCSLLPRTALVRGMLLKQVVYVVDLSTPLPLERVDSSGSC